MEDANENSVKKEPKKGLFRQLDALKDGIISLRGELNRISNEKESWFSKKEEHSKSLREKISIIRESREKRDALTKKVKELKGKRNALSEEAGKKISEFKKLNDEKKKLLSKLKVRHPLALKAQIGKIEARLETEAMPFDREKKLSKTLKDLKKSLSEASDYMEITEKAAGLNREINESRKDADKAHSEIQEFAKQSQVLHELVLKTSKEAGELKKKEEESFRNFINFKAGLAGINSRLKENLAEISGVREKINRFELEEEEKRRLEGSILIKTKEHEIEEKIKTGKKLTTDDFLEFQEMIKDKKGL